MSGYVRIHRSLIGHPAFRNDAEAMAFAWMVMRAAWKPIRVRYKERGIHLQRGQLAVSVRDFAAAHERNKNWVSRILQRMRDEGMIETSAGTGVLVITICNYDQYQADANTHGTVEGTEQGTQAGQTRDTEQVREETKEDKSEAIASVSPRFPLREALSFWNENAVVVGWSTAQTLNNRDKPLRNRLREHGLDGFKAAIARARASPYLAGPDPPHWFTFDWLLKPSNFQKLIEGNYDRRHSDSGDPTTGGLHLALKQLAARGADGGSC